jgi:predicted GNAT family N-acyltransferase
MYRIEPIAQSHHRKGFNSGKPELDDYLQRFARQNDEKNIARTFVAITEAGDVLGYYSLSTASISFATLTEDLQKALPAYPVPAALIARLAVDRSMKGQGLGAGLLIDALHRIVRAAEEIAVKVIMVDAKDHEARSFYQHYGFIELPEQPLKLFLPIETVNTLFKP